MRLLVTGGAGFIGSNFIRYVIEHPLVERLINLDCLTYAGHLENLGNALNHTKHVFEKSDIRDKDAVLDLCSRHQPTHIVHFAAESHVDRSIKGPTDFVQTNVVGTFHLLEAARSLPRDTLKLFLHVSTDEVYGTLGAEGRFTEQSPYAPNSPYSASKAASDFFVRAAHKTYGLPVIITNSSNNFGPCQFPEKLIPVVIGCLIHRQPIPIYGNGTHVRDWLYVRDHAAALWEVLQRGRVGESYNIGGDNEWTNLDLVNLLCDLFDEISPGHGGNSRKLISFVSDRPGHDFRYALDSAKLTRELGWTSSTDFRTALRETIRWYLTNQKWPEALQREVQKDC